MRMILLSLAALGAAAAGGAAAAQPGSLTFGHRGGTQAAPAASGPGLSFRAPRDFRRGRGPGRHRGRFGRGGGEFAYPFGYFGLADDGPPVDPHGNGFFAGRGGEIFMENGRPVYDYDRSYPYEWAGGASGPALGWVVLAPSFEGRMRCTIEEGVRVCRGRR